MELDAVARALFGAPLAPAQAATLDAYVDLLLRWNGTYNLTAVRDPEQMRLQHVADCLAVVPSLRLWRSNHAVRRLLDVGSGAGLPALVLAVMEPDLEVVSVDAVGKKAAFVRQAAGELRLPNLRAEHARVEQLRAGSFDLITSRAFASLSDFTRATRPHLGAGGAWMAMKGRRPDDEIAELPPNVRAFHVEPLAVPGLDAERCLVWMQPSNG